MQSLSTLLTAARFIHSIQRGKGNIALTAFFATVVVYARKMFTKSFTGKTWMTNNGMKHLCLDEEQQEGRGQAKLYRQVLNNSVVATVWRNGKYENEFFFGNEM